MFDCIEKKIILFSRKNYFIQKYHHQNLEIPSRRWQHFHYHHLGSHSEISCLHSPQHLQSQVEWASHFVQKLQSSAISSSYCSPNKLVSNGTALSARSWVDILKGTDTGSVLSKLNGTRIIWEMSFGEAARSQLPESGTDSFLDPLK